VDATWAREIAALLEVSPIARALMKAGEGEVVALRTHNGARRIEVVMIAYEEG
jgi:transcription elongation GreA/GreB family factor